MTTITIERELLKEVVELFDSAISARYPHEILRDIRTALAAPATAPEFPANWAQMIHYPECWDTAAYPELRDAIHEALAWSGCNVCEPATAPAQQERKPMTDADIEAAARRSGATAYTNRFVNGSAFSFGPEALREFVRAVESFKGTP